MCHAAGGTSLPVVKNLSQQESWDRMYNIEGVRYGFAGRRMIATNNYDSSNKGDAFFYTLTLQEGTVYQLKVGAGGIKPANSVNQSDGGVGLIWLKWD